MTTLSEIAHALGGAKRLADGGYSCRCPAHNDKHASLSLHERDGQFLWRCHAGCDQTAVRDELVSRDLIERKRANGHAPAPRRQAKPDNVVRLGKIVATYEYVDVTGALLFQVVRFEPKTFRQRRPDGGGWQWGLGRVKPILYRLPEVLAAETVYVVEGEKDVDNLREIGLTATSSPMGAGKWRPEFGEALAGKHVVILPDNDDQGRKHADDVAASARDHGAASIRIVELPKLPDHGDPSDWLAAGGNREQLEQLARTAPVWSESVSGGDPGWRSRLIQGDNGPLGNEANAETALRHAPDLVGRLRFDGFRTAAQAHNLPWQPHPEWRDWRDADSTQLAIWLQRSEVNIRPIAVEAVVECVATRAEYHPVRDYLTSLTWDGENRVDDWLITYLGCRWSEDRPDLYRYLRAVGKRWLVSAVARVMEPGCKADCALVLEGIQGAGKSRAARALAVNAEWFADQVSDLGSKDSAQDIRGKWIIELAELTAMSRSEVERVKAFMSRAVDHYRPSYGRRAIDVPRQCVFIGSTNKEAYLKDDTGERRFWPVRVGQIDVAALERDRDQLWAEALHLYRQDEQWWLTRDEDAIAAGEQAAREEGDAWGPLIDDWLGRTVLTFVTIGDILNELGIPKERWGQAEQNRIARHLRKAGWRREQRRDGNGRTYGYMKP